MQVLTRTVGERIFIGDNIVLTVVEINRGKMRLGIEAPRDIPIYREEVYKELQRANRQDNSDSCLDGTTPNDPIR